MRVLSCGPSALLVEFAGTDARAAAAAAAWLDRAETARPAAVTDLVPGARTVLITFDPAAVTVAAVRAWAMGLDAAAAPARPESPPAPLRIEVDYDGEDLPAVAAALGMTVPALITAHTAALWRCDFTGFAPGFGYLRSDGWAHTVPRLSTPRTRVPAGAVGLAGPYTGVYPRATAGGWQIIGRTAAVLWDERRDPPALIRPGRAIGFVAR